MSNANANVSIELRFIRNKMFCLISESNTKLEQDYVYQPYSYITSACVPHT